MTDSKDWLLDSVDSMKADCETEAVRNYSRWQQVAGSSEEKEPPTDIMDLICPGDCSNHGNCSNGDNIFVIKFCARICCSHFLIFLIHFSQVLIQH